jgi:C-terminal processing protease CtpA/Prc
MIRNGIISLLAGLLVAVAGQPASRAQSKAEASGAPDFKEVYESIRAHAAGLSEAELNRAAVEGLVAALGPKVMLVTNGSSAKALGETPLVSRSGLMEGEIAYMRIEKVGEGLANAVREAWQTLGRTNKLKGVVLDLRYARGDDYAAAAATADLFLKKDLPLLNWGNGLVRSKEKADAISVPAAVLVNRSTAGAAEALAAAMRETGAGLILGGMTAGQAMIAQEFPLKNGDRLRIATAPVQLGDGSALSSQGLKPDITVDVTPEDERAYYADAFKAPGRSDLSAGAGLSLTNLGSGTNRAPRRPRFNEAELVRERREGLSEADLTGGRDREAEKPIVYDPALARALDLLKGLAVVRRSRS